MSNLPTRNLPTLGDGGNLQHYLDEIKKFPVLSKEEEFQLATDWVKNQNLQSAHKLVTSHLRLVSKIALGYRGYGLPISDLVAEGNIGLMRSVKKFDPDKGFRLSTYAMWWIKASIQEYILRSWSLVKIGTTSAQKKLFFNLRKLRNKITMIENHSDGNSQSHRGLSRGGLSGDVVTNIANELNVSEQDVVDMNNRMGRDMSLNAPVSHDDGSGQWQDWLEDDTQSQEESFIENETATKRHQLLADAMTILNEREREIITARRLQDKARTLEDLSEHYNISRERIRQIENRAIEKLQQHIAQQV